MLLGCTWPSQVDSRVAGLAVLAVGVGLLHRVDYKGCPRIVEAGTASRRSGCQAAAIHELVERPMGAAVEQAGASRGDEERFAAWLADEVIASSLVVLQRRDRAPGEAIVHRVLSNLP